MSESGKHKKKIIVLIIVAVIAVVAFVMINSMNSTYANTVEPPQTLTLERFDLQQIVSGTGTIQSSISREVTSKLSYEIIEVYVAEGDQVVVGQLLARLDTSDIDADIEKVRKNISDASRQDALALSQAERKLQDAYDQYSIDETRLNNEVNNAYSQLTSANTARDAAKADMDNKKNLLDQANAALTAYPPVGDPSHDANTYSQLQQAATVAQTAYDAAVQTYNALNATADTRQSAYNTAVQQRDTTLRQNSISIENARDAVNTQKLKDSAATYRTQLEGYLKDKEDCEITAPISGTITVMTAEVGQSAGGSGMGNAGIGGMSAGTSSALFTIEDTNRLEISSSIPEYDTNLVKLGMQVEITSDAIDGMEWRGQVKHISTRAADESSNFNVVIEITSPVEKLSIGMSAKINIVTEFKKDVFAVPYDAVTTNAKGETIVYESIFSENKGGSLSPNAPDRNSGEEISIESTRREIRVVTGMETDVYIEISGDELYEGMVLLADPEERNVHSNTNTFGLMGGGMF